MISKILSNKVNQAISKAFPINNIKSKISWLQSSEFDLICDSPILLYNSEKYRKIFPSSKEIAEEIVCQIEKTEFVKSIKIISKVSLINKNPEYKNKSLYQNTIEDENGHVLNFTLNEKWIEKECLFQVRNGIEQHRKKNENVLILFKTDNYLQESSLTEFRSQIICESFLRIFKFLGYNVEKKQCFNFSEESNFDNENNNNINNIKKNIVDEINLRLSNSCKINKIVDFYEKKLRIKIDSEVEPFMELKNNLENNLQSLPPQLNLIKEYFENKILMNRQDTTYLIYLNSYINVPQKRVISLTSFESYFRIKRLNRLAKKYFLNDGIMNTLELINVNQIIECENGKPYSQDISIQTIFQTGLDDFKIKYLNKTFNHSKKNNLSAEEIYFNSLKYFELTKNHNFPYSLDNSKIFSLTENTFLFVYTAFDLINDIFEKENLSENSIKEIIFSSKIRVTLSIEKDLLTRLLKMNDILELVIENLDIKLLTTYIYELASKLIDFLDECEILHNDETNSRILILLLTQRYFKISLNLMGIEI